MIKDNRRQKLRLLTEWMDYFILENKEEIKRSLCEDERVFIQSAMEETNYDVDFGLMILSDGELDLTLKLTVKTGRDKGQSFWFDIQKRKDGANLLFNGNADSQRVIRYNLYSFMQYMSHQALTHLLEQVKETQEIKRASLAYKAEAEALIQESLVNFYLDRGQLDALELMFSKPEADINNKNN